MLTKAEAVDADVLVLELTVILFDLVVALLLVVFKFQPGSIIGYLFDLTCDLDTEDVEFDAGSGGSDEEDGVEATGEGEELDGVTTGSLVGAVFAS